MHNLLDNNDTLMYLTRNEGKSVVSEMFIKTLKGKIYKTFTANDSKSYIGYLNKLVDEYSNTYHYFIGQKHVNADYSALTEEMESSHKVPGFKVGDRARIPRYNNIFNKGCTENWSREIVVIDSLLKTNPWASKIKDLKGQKIIGCFDGEYIINELLSRTLQSYKR